MAAKTMGCEPGLKPCVLVLIVCFASSVSSLSRSFQPDQHNTVRVSYFPNAQHNFEFGAQLSEAGLGQQELDILQIKNDLDSLSPDVTDVVQHMDSLQRGLEQNLLQVRRKRDVTRLSTTQEVTEAQTGVLINFNTKFPTASLGGRRFALNSTSGNPEMFEVTNGGELSLKDGYHLDYEVVTMRSINFVVHATSPSNSSDVYEISATLTVTDVNEPPVFETQPQPYLATIRTDTGSGYTIITLVATDPEGQDVQYEKTSVSPNTYNNRIELRTVPVNGVRQCQLRTVGSNTFVPEGQTISITVSAKDAASGGRVVATTVSVLIGVRPPQFFQSGYQGSMLENNLPQQTVYKLGTSEELRAEWKTFQAGAVSLSLTREGGVKSENFTVQRNDNNNYVYIICTKVLDYEEANPKTQALTLIASQRVGDVSLSSSVDLTVEIQDTNDNRPVFDQSQYLKSIPENTTVGLSILEVMAQDKDTGQNAEIEYSLVGTEDFEIVTSRQNTSPPTYKGVIKVKRGLDYDRVEGPYYIFQVKATDRGTPPQTSTSNVRISVTNVNDEPPQILNPLEEVYEVQENANVDQFITQVQAIDGDGDKITYSFLNGNTRMEKFEIDRTSGVLTLAQTIAPEDDRFTLTVKATDDGSCCSGSSSLSSTITIYVQVYGINSERPDFRNCSDYSPSVDENSASGTSVLQVTAQDGDRGPNGVVRYSLSQSGDVFSINQSSGLIAVKASIDREVTSFVQVTVKGQDGGVPPEEGFCTFRVTVNDVNDNTPRFDKDSYKANITLNVVTQVPFLFVRAYDDDVGNNARIIYSLPNDAEGKFSIIPENGYISLNRTLTQTDVGQSYSLTAMAMDEGSPSPLNSTVSVRINVVAGNTEPPEWDRNYNQMTYNVDETVLLGFVIIKNMSCDSMIADKNVEFQLIRGDGTTGTQTEFFQLRQSRNTVSVLATGKFDYTNAQKHLIRIRCLNYGAVEMLTETNPWVVLRDTNNQIPEFQGLSSTGRYSAAVQENKKANTSVLTVEASDKDSTPPFNSVTFSLLDGSDNFTIEPGTKPNSAVIRTRIEFDREVKENYYLAVKAEDGAPSSLPGIIGHNTATVVVYVKITDLNDNAPYFEKSVYNINVNESTYINDLINPAIVVKDPDASDRGRHTYRITSGNTNNAFGIRNGLGNLFPLRKLDYEGSDKNFVLVVEASDGLFSASTTVMVTVMDVNDNSPVFDQDLYIVNDFYENDYNVPRYLLTINASDADVDRPNNIRYSLEGSSFNVNEYFHIIDRTGELFIDKPLDRDLPNGRPNWQFTVKAADELSDPNFGYATVSVMPRDVNDNKPKFITDPLEASVSEGATIGAIVVKIEAEDMDYGVNGTVEFFITNIVDGANMPRPDYFIIESLSGWVKTNVSGDLLDRESQDTYRLTIQLKDKGSPPMENRGTLVVTLSDVNDEWPVFEEKIYRTEMSENLQSGEVIRVVAKDNDIGDNAKVVYSLNGSNNHFTIKNIDNEGSVQVVPEHPVDYEDASQRFFNLTVKAQDKNSDHVDTCYLEITVLDFNDNVPKIEPPFQRGNVSENALPGTIIASFSATDADSSSINNEFEFSISRTSDPRRHFSIDAASGQVKVRRRLDRETQDVHELTILAIDKGSPALTGLAQLEVRVEDVNDNYPTFLKDYRPVLPENKDQGLKRMVQEVLAKDPDDSPYADPFGFKLDPACGQGCDKFSFLFHPDRASGNGTATVSTDQEFDREFQKYYLIPIIMWDMRGKNSQESQTGTNTLTITIGDENDNRMKPGTQDIFVYNYEGQFGPLDIGRVYVEDADDWDLPDKTFNYTGAAWMKNYFTVDYDTGMVMMKKGVPTSPVGKPYTFTVLVHDKHWKNTVTSTVSITVEELSEEAVRNSGATRFKGTSAEDFIQIPKASSSERNPQSRFQKFQTLLANKLNTDRENVQIISVQDVEGGFTDVRYSVHGSPYYPSSQTDSIVALKKKEFEDALNLGVEEVPIDACQEEVFEGGCYNYMNITGNPAMVNSNGTSFVGVEVFIRAMEGCRALDFPEPNECSGDYCYHGGTCVKNDFGVLSCTNCPEGFDGPRCQQLRHSFDGKSYAMYPTLEQCEDSHTSIEFITTQADGLLLYNGPLTPPARDQPRDFISLQLSGGMPVLHIDHGSGSATLSLDGNDQGSTSVINTLSDGKWHKIDIVRKGKLVEMMVDDCQAVGPSGSESQAPDTRPCLTSATTQGENSFLNVATLLQLGGRAPGHTFPAQNNIISSTSFNGCVRNLMHNSKYYDLHYKMTPEVPSGENGCPREDKLCLDDNGSPKCGNNGICTASFNTAEPPTCLCKPSWRGARCTEATEIRDLRRESFVQWRVKSSAQLLPYRLEVQVMYRTWDTNGVLFTVSTRDNSKRVTIELKDGHLQALYNLGSRDNILLLNHTQASNGFWHMAKFKRVMHVATLTLDQGEGRNHASRRDDQDSVYMELTVDSSMYGGASVTNPSGAQVLDRDLSNTCVQDVRLNGDYLPISSSENTLSTVAEWADERNMKNGCSRPDGCVPPPVCPLNAVCLNLWGHGECRCAPGYHELADKSCESDCLPENPCFLNSPCYITGEGTVGCNCTAPWQGPLCNIFPANEKDPTVGMAATTIVAIVVSIIVVLLLVLLTFFLVTYYMRKKSKDDFDKFVVEEDADFDIRENVMFYDEEGAGEEDQNAFDLAKLPSHETETMRPPVDMVPLRREQPRGRSAPDDRPDVGDVLHDRMHDADDDPDAPPYDTLISFKNEGAGSDAGSLSSLGSSSSDASQDYDYLNDWGPKFAKLADMYGTGGQG